jgi:NADH:ubiquinone oxidoreductase subunit F (NADH-binding)
MAAIGTARSRARVSRQVALEKHVVANADESDPGACIDRVILDDKPARCD